MTGVTAVPLSTLIVGLLAQMLKSLAPRPALHIASAVWPKSWTEKEKAEERASAMSNVNNDVESETPAIGSGRSPKVRGGGAGAPGRLRSRPSSIEQTKAPGSPGLHRLKLGGARDGLLYVPPTALSPAPLIVMLHGAGGDAHGAVGLLQEPADRAGALVLGVDSRSSTWDAIRGQFGPDVAFLDRALADTFSRHEVDPGHLAVAGFSDGASYALSLGLINGDLFGHVVAFTPGFVVPGDRVGSPRLFISHGTRDTVLPIERCSRKLVPRLQQAGYDVQYHEFDGPHTVPAKIARKAVDWFMKSPKRM